MPWHTHSTKKTRRGFRLNRLIPTGAPYHVVEAVIV
jgi:hypothetical protein